MLPLNFYAKFKRCFKLRNRNGFHLLNFLHRKGRYKFPIQYKLNVKFHRFSTKIC